MSEQAENRLELDIIEELKTKFPSRRVIMEIGENFSKKHIAERLTAYGEIRNSSDCGEFFEEQCKLYDIFLSTEIRGVIAPVPTSVSSKVLQCFIDRSITVNLLENTKLVGFVQLTMFADFGDMSKTEREIKAPSLTEQQNIDLKRLSDYTGKLSLEGAPKIRCIETAVFGRTLIVHPDHRRKGLGAHIKLIKLFAVWPFTTELLVGTQTVANTNMEDQILKEKFIEKSIAEILPMIPESDRHKFAANTSGYRYDYDKREQYYQSYLVMIRRAFERVHFVQT